MDNQDLILYFCSLRIEGEQGQDRILKKQTSLYSAQIYDGGKPFDPLPNPLEARRRNFPISSVPEPAFEEILGSYHGLLCIRSSDCCLIWNPHGKSHHILPPLAPPNVSEERKGWAFHTVSGLGFIEYPKVEIKVVRVYQFHGPEDVNEFPSEVVVYSLTSNSWRRVDDFPYYFHITGRANDVFVDNALHYIVSKIKKDPSGKKTVDSECLIAAFDVTTETYDLFSLPPGFLGGTLGVLCNRLCMTLDDYAGKLCQIFQKEHETKNSWALLFQVKTELSLRPITKLEYQNEELYLLEADGQLVLFDNKLKSWQEIEINYPPGADMDGIQEIYVCKEKGVTLTTIDVVTDDQMQHQVDAEEDEEHKSVRNDSVVPKGKTSKSRCRRRKRRAKK